MQLCRCRLHVEVLFLSLVGGLNQNFMRVEIEIAHLFPAHFVSSVICMADGQYRPLACGATKNNLQQTDQVLPVRRYAYLGPGNTNPPTLGTQETGGNSYPGTRVSVPFKTIFFYKQHFLFHYQIQGCMTWSNVLGCYSFERLKKQVILCIFHCFICQEGLVADLDLNNIYQKCKQNAESSVDKFSIEYFYNYNIKSFQYLIKFIN